MEISLRGKTAIVTGASRGIGKAIAKSFVDAGAQVMLTSRKLDALQAAAKEMDGETDVSMRRLSALARLTSWSIMRRRIRIMARRLASTQLVSIKLFKLI